MHEATGTGMQWGWDVLWGWGGDGDQMDRDGVRTAVKGIIMWLKGLKNFLDGRGENGTDFHHRITVSLFKRLV